MQGTFEVSPSHLSFSSTRLTGSLVITNHGPTGLDFKVRKVDHTEFRPDGQVRVTTSPLAWLSMGESTPARVQELSVFVDGKGGTRTVQLATAANPDLSRWEGRLEVESATLGKRTVTLDYVTRPEGRWTGTMHYFASFGDAGLEQWMANRHDPAALSQVGNAFVQRWGAMRQGRLSFDEFKAVVTATTSESWKWDSVRDVCVGAAACYLYHRAPGYAFYSDSLESFPIPTASSQLPVAVNLRPVPNEPLRLAGKIVTGEALQYSGDPELSVTFAADPSACMQGATGACLAPLQALAAQIQVGGRYATVASDRDCTRAAPGTFAQAAIPWLVPGFTEGTHLDAPSGNRYRYECRDKVLPFGADAAATNLSFAQSTYFTASSSLTRDAIAQLSCQQTGTCQQTLDLWRSNGSYGVRVNPVWRCTDRSKVYCDDDRLDLRAGKDFFPASSTTAVFVPLRTTIESAFRYKTQFRSRTGASVGFAPEICVPNSNAVPYCYDPGAIEEARARSSCALSLYSKQFADLDAESRNRLKEYLTFAFGYTQETSGANALVRDGFERLDAELLIMLGDEAYTRAFASRFDLAGSRMLSFQGSLFEPQGINLAGGAGNEMYNLYKAAQYYQLVLDRFYAMSPLVWQSVQGETARNFVGKETVVAYFDRLIRASTQKARAWSEVAKRYQSFNRPDLARHVTQRAYASAYLESVVLSRMILGVVAVADPADRAFITSRAELASLGYRAALLDMREVYAGIKDQPTYFGDAPDFIPFPALEPGDVNAFAKLLSAAQQSVAAAATKEQAALSSNRAFDTDAAQFQSELIRVRTSYESQLGEVCGTFVGTDGLVHPATRTYAYLDERAKLVGDPCGMVGNGRLHEAMAAIELTRVDIQAVNQRLRNVDVQTENERERASRQCKLTLDLADYRFAVDADVNNLRTLIASARATQGTLERVAQHASTYAGLTKCQVGPGGTDCPSAAVAAAAYASTTIPIDLTLAGLDTLIISQEHKVSELQRAASRFEIAQRCEVLQTDSDITMRNLALELESLKLEALKVHYRLKLDIAQVQKLRNEASRLLAEKEELEQQTINVEAARNDPNVRIYKNDAVLLADHTFQRALQAAYRATRAFEYYTSRSYPKLAQLFLIRMVSHGDYNLETYLIELEAAYRDFQQRFGNPDTRVEIVSLRDDVLGIPRLDASGRALTQAERTALFRAKLADASFLDARGYRVMPFSTDLTRLSPLTRNHKVLGVESELIGVDLGDSVGRLYLRQRGTGMVQSVDGEKSYYRLPERTAVLNPFFNGVRAFSADVYRSDRMRDRPLVNTHWELVINQQDEQANKDINLQSLTDVRIYVYYTDFTRL